MSAKFLPAFKYLNFLLKYLVLLMVLWLATILSIHSFGFPEYELNNSGNHSKAEGTHKILRNYREKGSD